MPIYAYFINESPVKLWGLTSRQRNIRVLKSAGVTDIVRDLSELPDNDSVLLLRGDYLFDDRVIRYLVQSPDLLLKISQAPTDGFVAAHVATDKATRAVELIKGASATDPTLGVRTETLETLTISFQQQLLKFEPPFVLPISSETQRILERRLFDWSYKGVTDLVTKWVWPRPAQWVVGQCVRFGLRPNHVTIIGLLLVILAGVLFANGWYGWGLIAGWLMTFLDTVDGKLARVTVTSSPVGHYFDHIIDLVHPPIWYALWGLGLGTASLGNSGLALNHVLWAILIAYTAGRLVEGTFQLCLGRFGIFCWRPLDSYFRLVTARRNPNMIILTLSVLGGRPDLGLLTVALWTVLTSLFLLFRLAQAGYVHFRRGPLRSWLKDVNRPQYNGSLAVGLFTRHADDK
ncbi:MAG: CDP-alcohol phosphatidyltransferase family protein [Desulfobacterales bacterium]|jgi:phosphatidylglycerophosphate synthase